MWINFFFFLSVIWQFFLQEFYLHGNKLTHLKQCEKNFPENIQILTLHKNLISDLNEVSHLAQFSFLKELSFHDNPCVSFVDDQMYPFRSKC